MGNQAEAEELQLSTFGVSRGLSWVREDVVGSKLNPSWYFEGGRGNR